LNDSNIYKTDYTLILNALNIRNYPIADKSFEHGVFLSYLENSLFKIILQLL